MPFLGPALGWTEMCSPGWGNLVAIEWNDLPVGREFEGKFLKNVKSPPHALPPPFRPPPHPAGLTLIGALYNDLQNILEKKLKSISDAKQICKTETETQTMYANA